LAASKWLGDLTSTEQEHETPKPEAEPSENKDQADKGNKDHIEVLKHDS